MSAIKAEINEKLEEHLRSFKKHCVGLGVYEGEVPILIGSGTLISCGMNYYILTAAHLFEEHELDEFHIFTGQNSIPLEGDFIYTDINQSIEASNEFCLVKLKVDQVKEFTDFKFADLAGILPLQTASKSNVLFFVGFPWKKNRANKYNKKHKLSSYVFYNLEEINHNNPRFNVYTHCAIVIDTRTNKCINEKQQKVTAPELKGISGGPIFIINSDISSNRNKNILVGICIEYDKKSQVMYGIRLSKILDLLQAEGYSLR